MKTAVVYQSAYGSTKQYAQWIAEALDAALFERKECKPDRLMEYDLVIYGGGIYAGKISGVDLVTKHPCNQLILFTVGFENPETANYQNLLESNLTASMRETVQVFHLRGNLDYGQMSLIHKGMMAVLKKMLQRAPEEEQTDDVKEILASYGGKLEYINRDTIMPLITYAKSMA